MNTAGDLIRLRLNFLVSPPPDLFLSPTSNTVTLVPHVGRPRLRNIELGNSDVKVKNREQSEASESAHVFAEIMGVFPDDDEGVAQPGKKSIATKVVHKVTKVTSKAKTDTREKFG